MPKEPVGAVTKAKSPATGSSVTSWEPSMHAWSAQAESMSMMPVMWTRAPAPRMAKAQPWPTLP
eukprot:10573151-Lingulodinium_polyedra.AAC.1